MSLFFSLKKLCRPLLWNACRPPFWNACRQLYYLVSAPSSCFFFFKDCRPLVFCFLFPSFAKEWSPCMKVRNRRHFLSNPAISHWIGSLKTWNTYEVQGAHHFETFECDGSLPQPLRPTAWSHRFLRFPSCNAVPKVMNSCKAHFSTEPAELKWDRNVVPNSWIAMALPSLELCMYLSWLKLNLGMECGLNWPTLAMQT